MVQIDICMGSACFTKGSDKVVKAMKQLIEDRGWQQDVNLRGSFCIGFCSEKNGLGIKVDGEIVPGITMVNAVHVLTKEIEDRLAKESV